jgi:hypothetical protein
MPIDLSQRDHQQLDKLLDGILTSYANREVPLAAARTVLAQLITAAAADDGDELRGWLEHDQLARWQEEIRRYRV